LSNFEDEDDKELESACDEPSANTHSNVQPDDNDDADALDTSEWK